MIILDTNVLSELMRSHPAAPVFAWAVTQPRTALYTTSINKAEIFYGIAVLPEGRRRAALAAAAETMFIDDFAGRVLPFDEEAAARYAEIVAARRREGRPIEAFRCADRCDRVGGRGQRRYARRRRVFGLRSHPRQSVGSDVTEPTAARTLTPITSSNCCEDALRKAEGAWR